MGIFETREPDLPKHLPQDKKKEGNWEVQTSVLLSVALQK